MPVDRVIFIQYKILIILIFFVYCYNRDNRTTGLTSLKPINQFLGTLSVLDYAF